MADIFVSYARVDKARVAPLVAALEAQGWSVWWDSEITGGQQFDELIARELGVARAAIVVWTQASVVSRWVRGEARIAADRSLLVPVQMGVAELPIDARVLHTIDLSDWNENAAGAQFKDLVRALGGLLGAPSPGKGAPAQAAAPKASICVLPFTNMSGDAEQEYFSDGISEDIITDLSKISSLIVASRNSAFAYKGKQVDLMQVARQLRVSHILEGSVRKSGNRVRITAQLIDGATNNHIWAERYDRDLSDIFALQDEISQAIVAALKLRLMPQEKQALGQRGTNNAEAYRLYLMARQYGTKQSDRYSSIALKLCQNAVELDPNYAVAWAKIARLQKGLRANGRDEGDPEVALKRASDIDPNLAEVHITKAALLNEAGRFEEADAETAIALRLDPESYDVYTLAASSALRDRRYADAIRYYEKAAAIVDTDFGSLSMASQAYQLAGDMEGARSAARRALDRIEKEIAADPANGGALGHGASLWAFLGQPDNAKEWAARAALVDPNNRIMQYNLACTMVLLGDFDAALRYIEPYLKTSLRDSLVWAQKDPDLDPLHDHPRFKAMMAETDARLSKLDAAKGTN